MSKYVEAVEHGLKGLTAVSTGPCPDCEQCMRLWGYETLEEFRQAWTVGKVESEGAFSWSECGICGTGLGGDREVWHGVNSRNEIVHFDDACTDCAMYLANGEEPDEWVEDDQEDDLAAEGDGK